MSKGIVGRSVVCKCSRHRDVGMSADVGDGCDLGRCIVEWAFGGSYTKGIARTGCKLLATGFKLLWDILAGDLEDLVVCALAEELDLRVVAKSKLIEKWFEDNTNIFFPWWVDPIGVVPTDMVAIRPLDVMRASLSGRCLMWSGSFVGWRR